MDSELDEEMQEAGEPLAKQEKAEAEVIQVLQVGTMEDGSSAVVGVVQPDMLGTMGMQQSTIRHCSGAGNAYASVWHFHQRSLESFFFFSSSYPSTWHLVIFIYISSVDM